MTAKKRILAFEIGTFFTRYVVFEDGRMGIPGTIATPVDGEEPFYQALAHIVSKQRAPLDGIAISVPGFIDTEKQVAVTAGALSILYGHEIGRKLQGYLDDPIPTWMENDANCAAMAEKLSGNAVKLDDFALITIDSGVGGALFLDGRIRRGKDWRAGELGMMIPNYETGGFHTMQDYLSTIVLAEGCWESMAPFDMYGFLTSHGKQCFEGEPMSAMRFASIMKRMCGMVEARSTVVGYTQRGALPVAKDSAFAFEAGNLAVRLLRDGISNQVIGVRQGKVFNMPIVDALKVEKHFRRDLYDLVNNL